MIGFLLKRRRCGLCGSRFSRQEDLMHHMGEAHSGGSPYDCRECGRDFPSMEDMRAHLQREHNYEGSRSSRRPGRRAGGG